VALAEVGPVTLALSTLAAAEAVLTPDERELGVVVVDLGAATTGLACYVDGALAHSAVLPLGGRHMTNDLAVVLQTPLAQAERIKTTHGHVLPELDDDETAIDVVPFGQSDGRTTTRRYVSEVLAARADELATLVLAELEAAGLAGRLPAGAVLVGGGSELGGLPRRLHARWSRPVRMGRTSEVAGLADAARGPAHAGACGLLLWGAKGVRDAAGLSMAAERVVSGAGVARVLSWAKAAFLPSSARVG
jgi:cell division protein FtsA